MTLLKSSLRRETILGDSTPVHKRLGLSVVIPVYNEEQNIPRLVERLRAVLEPFDESFEVIVVNDGSTDGSLDVLRLAQEDWPALRIIDFRRNFGQTAAMQAGLDHARGDVIVSMDADLQNDPDDIPMLLSTLDKGYDVVSGWRKDRQDAAIRRNLISRIANVVISRVSGVRLKDYGCTLKAYRRDVVEGVRLYGEMHRFIPIYASWQGARVTEVPVRHHARTAGRSKYGLERVFKVMLDLMVVKFLERYFTKPIYIFGGFGLLSIGVAIVSFLLMVGLRIFGGVSFIETPLPLLTSMTLLVGILSMLVGLLAEITVRTYFESQGRAAYHIRTVYGFDEPDD